MTEILRQSQVSCMQSFVNELVQQSTEAGMIVNGHKTKEMLVGTVARVRPPSVS